LTERQQTIWKWAGRIMILLAGLGGIIAAADYMPAMVKNYAALAVALLGFAARWAEQQLPPVKGPKGPPVAILLILAGCLIAMGMAGCPKPYDAAWRTVDAVQKTRDLTAQQLASAANAKHTECKKAHGAKTPGFADCVKKHRDALDHWRKIARPATNSAIQVTATSLQIAERVEANKPKIDWISLLKPAACALFRVARSWGHYWPDKGKTVLNMMSLLEGVTCE
jgi:hypothetical protein